MKKPASTGTTGRRLDLTSPTKEPSSSDCINGPGTPGDKLSPDGEPPCIESTDEGGGEGGDDDDGAGGASGGAGGSGGGGGELNCFSADAMVQVLVDASTQETRRAAMKDLSVRDKILTGSGKYQEVFSFAHWGPNQETMFLKIMSTGGEGPLEISQEHLLYLEGKTNPVKAQSIQVGDLLQGTGPVEGITMVQKKGLYAPLTADGTLMVNGVKTSSYASIQRHDQDYVTMQGGWVLPFLSQNDGIHWSLTPFRMACTSSWTSTTSMCHSYDNDGYPHLVGKALKFALWLDAQELVAQIVALLFWFVLLVPMVILEAVFLRLAPMGTIVLFLLYVLCYQSPRVVTKRQVGRKNSTTMKSSRTLLLFIVALGLAHTTEGAGLRRRNLFGRPSEELDHGPMVVDTSTNEGIDEPISAGAVNRKRNLAPDGPGPDDVTDPGPDNPSISVDPCNTPGYSCSEDIEGPGSIDVPFYPGPGGGGGGGGGGEGVGVGGGSSSSGTSEGSSTGMNCFSADARVQVLMDPYTQETRSIPMKDLAVRDKILTGSGKCQEVYSFAHWDPNQKILFLKIHTSEGEGPLEISHEHLVYLEGKRHPVRAQTIQVGDLLEGAGPVKGIVIVQKKGLYAPLTAEGTLMVNGVKASSYASIQVGHNEENVVMQGGWTLPFLSQHDCIHLSLAPFRMICASSWVATPSMCHSYGTDGYPHLIGNALKFARWLDDQNLVTQTLAFFCWLVLLAPLIILEALFLGIIPMGALALFSIFVLLQQPQIITIRKGRATSKRSWTTKGSRSLLLIVVAVGLVHATAAAGVRTRKLPDDHLNPDDDTSSGSNPIGEPGDGPNEKTNPPASPEDDDDGGGSTSSGASEGSSTGLNCFSADATVQVLVNFSTQEMHSIPMRDLVVGDKILTGSGQCQPVYSFAHWNPNPESLFLKIHTSEGEGPLEITQEHLVYLEGKTNPVPAQSIQIGDILQGGGSVKGITIAQKKGLYAPLTPDGTLVVNGVKASSYVSIQQGSDEGYVMMHGGLTLPFLSHHDGIHLSFAPFRMICTSSWAATASICHSCDNTGLGL